MTRQPSAIKNLQFVKLGGSLITNKARPMTPRPEVLTQLAEEISAAMRENPDLRILLGHGAGSFAHVPAKQHGTRDGVHSKEEWRGFAEVWRQAAALHQLVMAALAEAEIPALSFPPSAAALASDGHIDQWPAEGIHKALEAGLLPVVYGDVAFDRARGGTILSTEDLFVYLADELGPIRILLAGEEEGVFVDYPGKQKLAPRLGRSTAAELGERLGAAAGADVTGGMAAKVAQMLDLVERMPAIEVRIFSGRESGNLRRALAGEALGTLLVADPPV